MQCLMSRLPGSQWQFPMIRPFRYANVEKFTKTLEPPICQLEELLVQLVFVVVSISNFFSGTVSITKPQGTKSESDSTIIIIIVVVVSLVIITIVIVAIVIKKKRKYLKIAK